MPSTILHTTSTKRDINKLRKNFDLIVNKFELELILFFKLNHNIKRSTMFNEFALKDNQYRYHEHRSKVINIFKSAIVGNRFRLISLQHPNYLSMVA